MRIFCDTSVLVAASVQSLDHHARAYPVLDRVIKGSDEGVIGLHSVAEVYSTMTRLSVTPRIQPSEATLILQNNILKHFKIQTLGAGDYEKVVEAISAKGLIGGAIYDALLLACAEKAGVSRIYTFNLSDFRRIAPHLSNIIAAP